MSWSTTPEFFTRARRNRSPKRSGTRLSTSTCADSGCSSVRCCHLCARPAAGPSSTLRRCWEFNGTRNRAAYAPSKGAVVLLTKCMAVDHGHENIRVNAICPSFVETDLTAAIMRTAPDPGAVRRERIGVHPIGRLGQPEDLAGLAVYLAGDESSWATGAVFPVDGGYLAV